jgi:transcriptional regulator with XRE-family HTH domain
LDVDAAIPEGGPAVGPTVLRILLGGQLRRLREAKGVTREAAGYAIRGSESKISRLELGRVGFKERDVADLLSLYGVTDERERAALLSLARQANLPGWWHRYSDVLPAWFQPYLGLEGSASLIRTYELQFIPGLLQTPDYARSVIMLGHDGAGRAEIDRRVAVRRGRQQILTRLDAPRFWVVIDEAVLRRPIGGPFVMRGQVAELLEAGRLPNVTIQVVPFAAGGHAAAGGAFTLLRFPEQDLPDVVYTEQLTGGFYLDKREDVDAYAAAMDRLSAVAASPDRTADILARTLADLEAEVHA